MKLDSILNPFLIVGTGRCGSSFVASILHNELGVHMGDRFRRSDAANPEGYYEDGEFVILNQLFLHGEITLPNWGEAICREVGRRQRNKRAWGIKDPRLSELLGLYLTLFDNPRIIWCRRPKELVINSWITKFKGTTLEEAQTLYKARTAWAGRLMRHVDHLSIHFDENRKTKEEIIAAIVNKWPDFFKDIGILKEKENEGNQYVRDEQRANARCS